MAEYFKKITFPDNIHIPDTTDSAIPPCDIYYSTTYNILVQIEKLTNKEICDKIIEFAKNNGVTDLYLLDEEFVTTALKNEAERRTQPKNNFDRIRNMSVEEMAEFMRKMLDCVSCQNKMMNNNNPFGKEKCNDIDYFKMCEGDYTKCIAVCKQWLLQEVSENDR